jgi:hypothetical protein
VVGTLSWPGAAAAVSDDQSRRKSQDGSRQQFRRSYLDHEAVAKILLGSPLVGWVVFVFAWISNGIPACRHEEDSSSVPSSRGGGERSPPPPGCGNWCRRKNVDCENSLLWFCTKVRCCNRICCKDEIVR